MYRDKIFAILLFSFGVLSLIVIGYVGRDYYFLPLADKYNSELHNIFGPSGLWGHGLGIIGSVLMILNFMYSWRKRFEFKEKLGSLKGWLEFHMFVGLFGPTLIIYHSAFKFNGIIASISFFSMVVVVISGIIGRYLYVQIPHNISGTELSLAELEEDATHLKSILNVEFAHDVTLQAHCEQLCNFKFEKSNGSLGLIRTLIKNDLDRRKKLSLMISELRNRNVSENSIQRITRTVKQQLQLTRNIVLWANLHKLLDTWRILHKKLSWVLFATLLVHVVVTILFGFVWIF